MTEAWIKATLPVNPKGTRVILEETPNGTFGCSIANMLTMFGSVDTTYAALSATPQASAGWQKYFDDWKAKGLIS